MKTKSLLTVVALIFLVNAFAQKLSVDLTFTAINNTSYVQLDSIKVMNRSQDSEIIVYYPDTTLSLDIITGDTLLYIGYSTGFPVGIKEINKVKKQFQLFQNYPNPVKDQSVISMYIPEKGTVNIIVSDMQGRLVITDNWQLDEGNHSFRFSPSNGNIFFLTARWNGISRSIKIITSESNFSKRCILDYNGKEMVESPLKDVWLKNSLVMQESGILDFPAVNETITFQFATNIPCPGTPTVTYEGQVYNTIQIFSQCWFKENLNVGTMIPISQDQTNNGIIEKYCYNNNADSCIKYGGLYQWNEMMQYNIQQGVQGICPPGWHLPTDEEWKVLEGAVDSLYGIGDPLWDSNNYRGFDAGMNLKSNSGWQGNVNGSDQYGFSGLPGGVGFFPSGAFFDIGTKGSWWNSTLNVDSYSSARTLSTESQGIFRMEINMQCSVSVRCMRDY